MEIISFMQIRLILLLVLFFMLAFSVEAQVRADLTAGKIDLQSESLEPGFGLQVNVHSSENIYFGAGAFASDDLQQVRLCAFYTLDVYKSVSFDAGIVLQNDYRQGRGTVGGVDDSFHDPDSEDFTVGPAVVLRLKVSDRLGFSQSVRYAEGSKDKVVLSFAVVSVFF